MHQRIATAAVDEAGSVAHQILYRDLPIGRNGFGGRFAAIASGNPHVGEFRKVFAQGIVDENIALLVEHQGAHCRHGFGHRGDVEDRVSGHGDAGGLVTPAIRIERNQFSVPRDQYTAYLLEFS